MLYNSTYNRVIGFQLSLYLCFAIIIITFIRFLYYEEFLPNTFYAKVGGMAVERGFSYLWLFGKYHILYGMCIIFLPYVVYLRRRAHREYTYLLIPFMLHILYVLYIGGDFKPTGRFLLTLSTFFCILSTLLLQQLYTKRKIWMVVVLILSSLYSRGLLWQKSQHWAKTRQQNFVARKAAGIFFQKYTLPDQSIAMHSVGAVPFYAQRYCIDMWGLNDKVIARTPVKNFGSGMAGHERSNTDYVFSKEPDFFIPEDNWLQLERFRQRPSDDLPDIFSKKYVAVSVPLGASWMNFWIHKRNLKYGEDNVKGLQWNKYVWEKP